MSTVKGPCPTCSGAGRLRVQLLSTRAYYKASLAGVPAVCPKCAGTGQIESCAFCGDVEPETHSCRLACGFELPYAPGITGQLLKPPPLCLAACLGAVTLGPRSWARCEAHGGLDAADDERRAVLQLEAGHLGGCQLCDQESELEPGSFTPHEHAGEVAPPAAAAPPQLPPPAHVGADITAGPPGEPAPPATSRKRRRKKPTSAPAIARRRRQPMAPELPGIPDHHDVPWCGCDRCWNGDA